MKKIKSPIIYSNKIILLLFMLPLVIILVPAANYYFNEAANETADLVLIFVYVALIILLTYQYLTIKCFHIRSITKDDYNAAFEYALSINNIQTSPLPDGPFKTKRFQVKDSNAILEHQYMSFHNAGAVMLKKAKDSVLYDKMYVSMKQYISDNNITRQTKYTKFILTVLAIGAVALAIAFGVEYFVIS